MNDSNFFSIDRLVEFGLGMAMARQMVSIMNESMKNMYVPGSIQSMPTPQVASNIYVAIGNNPVGPLTEKEFAALVAEQKVTKETLVWSPGMLGWKPLQEVPSILKIIAMAPPPLPKQ